MKKFIIIFLSLIFFGQVFANITSVEKRHQNIVCKNRNGVEVKYHNNHYDLLFSGTNKWAVCFNFSEYFSNTENEGIIFKPQRLKIFADDEEVVNLSIFGGNSTSPNDSVFASYEDIPLTHGWNTFQLPVNLDLRNIFWFVISSDSEINSTASYGTGAHSFYWVQTTETTGYFANMQAYNFNAELLFTLEGVFTDNVHNLELADFKYINNNDNPLIYSPRIKIVNNGMNPISNFKLNININSSSPDFNPYIKEINFTNELPGGDSLEINAPDSLSINLSENFAQYNFHADLICTDTLDFSYDNSKEYASNNFPYSQNEFLLENFLLSSDEINADLWDFQASVDSMNFHTVNYFPLAYDTPYYNADSSVRFNFYDGINYPTTVMNGYKRLTTFGSNYQNDFQTYCDSLDSQKTFINFHENSGTNYSDGRMVFRATLNNEDTYLFTNFASSLKLYVALIRDSFDDVVPQNYFVGYISSPSGDNITLNYQESADIYLEWNKTDFPQISDDDWNNCRLIYWIQSSDKIYFVKSADISDFEYIVQNDNENIPPISIKSGPNPFNPEMAKYKIIFTNKNQIASKIRIYNIKGQLVRILKNKKRNSVILWDGKNYDKTNCPSGVYLMRIFNEKKTITKKIILMK